MFSSGLCAEFTPFPIGRALPPGSPSQLTIPHNTRSYLRIISQPERQEPWERANTRHGEEERERVSEREREGGGGGERGGIERNGQSARGGKRGYTYVWRRLDRFISVTPRTRKGEHDVALLYKIRARQVPLPGNDTL